MPFPSGRYLPALIHETELCYEGIRSILTIKQRPKACPEKGALSDSVSTLIVRYSVLKSNCAALSSIKVLFLLCDQVEQWYSEWTVQGWGNVLVFRTLRLTLWSLTSLTVEERAASKRTEIFSKTSSSGTTIPCHTDLFHEHSRCCLDF